MLLGKFKIDWIDEADSRLAMELVAMYRLSTGLGFADFHIAAQALNRQATLFTFNMRHFKAVQGQDARVPFARLADTLPKKSSGLD